MANAELREWMSRHMPDVPLAAEDGEVARLRKLLTAAEANHKARIEKLLRIIEALTEQCKTYELKLNRRTGGKT